MRPAWDTLRSLNVRTMSDPNAAPSGAPKPQRHETSETDKAKARKWFKHAETVAATKNYDYAVELYVNGLALWPDAVDEGLRKLRVVATARKLAGGKPAGFLEASKKSTGGKDYLKSLANGLFLFGKDPGNLGHMEAILTSAAKAKLDRVIQWIAPVICESISGEKKQAEKRYHELSQSMEVGADLAMAANDYQVAVDILQAGLRVAQIWSQHYPDSSESQKAYSRASSKQTIVKGRFGSGETFMDSVKDSAKQADIRDRDSSVQSVDRMAEMIAKARREWDANRELPAKLINLVDLILKREEDEAENEAIALLEEEYAAHSNYAMKLKADDIRMRQMKRHIKRIATKHKAEPDNEDVKKLYAKYLMKQRRVELDIYRERLENYPTDMRVRFELATRYFKAQQFDDAIPLFQQSQADGRHRNESKLYIGRAFLEKGLPAQAVDILRAAIEQLEMKTDETAKELNYWLARSFEADGQVAEARKTYGQLIQLDYNFRDARQRLEALSAAK